VQDALARDRETVDAVLALADRHRRWGFWKIFRRLRKDGHVWNHKRVYRVYCRLGLNHKRRAKRRIPARFRQYLETPPIPNCVWALDFMEDRLYAGRRFRTLNVLDEGVREALHIEIDTSITGVRAVRVMEQLKAVRDLPAAIRCDNGTELTSQAFMDWCEAHGIEILYIQPGKPDQNAYIERFNRTYREEVLSSYLFEDLDQVRELTHWWLISYNEQRPHDALGGLTPVEFRTQTDAELSTSNLSE
jgi:putative transposase